MSNAFFRIQVKLRETERRYETYKKQMDYDSKTDLIRTITELQEKVNQFKTEIKDYRVGGTNDTRTIKKL